MNDMVDRTPRRRLGRTRDQPVETRRVTSLTSNRLIAAIGERCDFIDDRIRHAGNETVGELRWSTSIMLWNRGSTRIFGFAGGRWIRTCMGLLLSSSDFGL
jgi:hypothetical protein